MAIDCDHPRPPLLLPRRTPAQLAWQVPSYFSEDPREFRRQLLEVLSGIYLEEQTRFASPTIIPLHGENLVVGPGSVLKGVASGQTVTLLPSAPGGTQDPVVFILTAVADPLVVALPPGDGTDGTQTTLGTAGVHTFYPDDVTSYQQPPGDSSVFGTGVTGPVLIGRNEATLGSVVALSTTDTAEIDAVTTSSSALSWVLNVASVAFSKLANLTGLSLLGRAANSAGVMAAITASAARQVPQVNDAGTALAWGDPLEVRDSGADQGDAFAINFVAGTNINLAATVAARVATITPSVDLTSVTYTAGDGIDLAGNVFSADVSDFAGTGLEDDGANNLRIAAAAAGAGLTGGGGSALAVGAGAGITVNANDVQLDTMQDDQFLVNISGGVAVPSPISLTTLAGAGLTGGENAVLNVGGSTSITVNANDVQRAALTGFATASANSNATTSAEPIVTYSASSNMSAERVLTAGTNTTVDVSVANQIRINATDTDTTYTAGDGLDLTGTTFSADVSDFAGAGIEDDGANNLRIAAAAAGAGLTGGGGSALAVGAGTGITVNANDVAVNLNDIDSTSIVVSGGTLQRAAVSGDVVIAQNSNTAAIGTGVIVNADVNASAAIATSKLADGADFARRDEGNTFAGFHNVTERLMLAGVFTTSATGTVSNLNIGDVNVVVFTGANPLLTGMVASNSGHFVQLVMAGSGVLTVLKDTTSSAANRFAGGASSLIVDSGDMTCAWYNPATSLWYTGRGLA